jgi:hypothetical protein
MAQDMKSAGMIMDILSDKSGINIHRFQTFLFNIIFGAWFLSESLHHLFVPPACKPATDPLATKAFIDCLTNYASSIMPVIAPNNLVLLAASSGVYAALKTTENKQQPNDPDTTGTSQSNTGVLPSTNPPINILG